LRSYHRLLDIKDGKHLDLEVLGILVQAVNSNTLDNSGVGCRRHRAAALKLFGRLTSHFVAEAKLWRLYAKLVAGVDSSDATQDGDTATATTGSAENAFKAAQLMQKSVGAAVQVKDWSKSRESCVETLELAAEAIECKSFDFFLPWLSHPNLTLQSAAVLPMPLSNSKKAIFFLFTPIGAPLQSLARVELYKILTHFLLQRGLKDSAVCIGLEAALKLESMLLSIPIISASS